MTIVIATHTPQAATDHPSHISNLGSLPVMMDVLTQFVKSEDNPLFTVTPKTLSILTPNTV